MNKLNQTNARCTIVGRLALLLALTFIPAISQAEEVKTVPIQIADITTFKLVAGITDQDVAKREYFRSFRIDRIK
jgi:hypothetical protein